MTSIHRNKIACTIAFAAAVCLFATPAYAQSFGINVSSLVGTSGEDEITATEIQSDGTILVGGNFASAPDIADAETVGAASDSDNGYVLVLSSDGRVVERMLRVGAAVHDMTLDDADRVLIAAGSTGVVQLDANLDWQRTKTFGDTYRVDADGGLAVTLSPTHTEDPHGFAGEGSVTLFDIESGVQATSFRGHANALDVCLDADSETIGLVGYRAEELEGLPTQIAYLRGYDYDGLVTWSGYDWGTEPGEDGYLNAPGENSDSTRGYRCSIGEDGFLYAAFEADGADHLFRFSPQDVESPVNIVGGDEFHEFSDVRGEEKVFFARYEPSDGSYLLGQQLVARVGDQAGNTVRVRRGAIEADAAGNIYLVGESAYGLPIQYLPPGTGDYTGGAFLLSMNSDFSERRYSTRVTPNGAAYDVAARPGIGDAGLVVYGGVHELADGQFFASNEYQGSAGGETDGFVTVFGEGLEDRGGASGDDSGGDDAGCSCAATGSAPIPGFALALIVLAAARLRRRV
ncbi:MAG: MYXO-CTERM sorting domain-containing protein [Myxococcota bacterium]